MPNALPIPTTIDKAAIINLMGFGQLSNITDVQLSNVTDVQLSNITDDQLSNITDVQFSNITDVHSQVSGWCSATVTLPY